MGARNSNDFAVEAHWKLLVSSGSFPAHSRIISRHPFPRGSHIEGLVVDDHFGIAIDKPTSKTNALKVAASFEAGRRGYAQANLRVSDDKALNGHTEGVVVGTELLGDVGQAAALPPPGRADGNSPMSP